MSIGPWELLIILFILGGPLLLAIMFVVFLFMRTRSSSNRHSGQETPLEILKQRYARGEIDSDEFEERRRRILDDPR